jgi:predicted transcriptional regulator
LNPVYSLHARKEDETECVTCIGDRRNIQRILMGKLELKGKLKKLKLYGSLRLKLILRK